jgi:hypothetical protein
VNVVGDSNIILNILTTITTTIICTALGHVIHLLPSQTQTHLTLWHIPSM